MSTDTIARQPRRFWLAYQSETLLGEVGADNSGRAITKAAREFGVQANTIRIESKATGREVEPRAKGAAPASDAPMTPEDVAQYQEDKAFIRKHNETFVEAGTRLLRIRNDRTYRLEYPTFEAFTQAELGWNRDYANKQIRAAQVMVNLDTRVSKDGEQPAIEGPRTEKQVRPLTQLPAEEQAEAWQEAVQAAPNGRPTAATVRGVVDRRLGKGETIVDGVEGECREVAEQRAWGRIPVHARVVVTSPGDGGTTTVQEVAAEIEERKAIQEDEMSDDDWFEALPIAKAGLATNCKALAKRDALFFRQIEHARKEFKAVADIAFRNARKGATQEGAYMHATSVFFRKEHPKYWRPCPPMDKGGCGGKGTLITGYCQKCFGRGYTTQ